MKKKSAAQSAFLNPRILIGLAIFLSGVCLALAGLGTFSKTSRSRAKSAAAIKSSTHSITHARGGRNIEYSPADKDGRFRYMIQFTENGMLHRQTRSQGQHFQMNTPQSQTLRAQVMAEQAGHIQAMTRALGHGLNVSHYFLVTHSGVAASLTPEEAQTIRGVPGIKSVERERLYHTTTFRSPEFIGANQIWDGTAVPGGTGTKGEGIIIAMLDTGIDPTHPSFANDPDCGHGTTEPDKLLSALDCSSTDPSGLCNGPDPTDHVDHGTHTSSEAGGNTVGTDATPPPFLQISGVAPCASIRAYRVCQTNNCADADIEAGIDSVLIQGDAKILSFSISGGTDPWSDNDRDFLDVVDSGVLVSAAAGNTGDGVPDPVGQVNHRGPWVLSCAAATKDQELDAVLSASGPGSPPPETQNIPMTQGSASPIGDPLTDFPIRHFTGQNPDFEGCSTEPPFPANFFDGAVALIRRGNCTFTEKINNAAAAGAAMVVIRNNQPGTIAMDTTGQDPDTPAYSISDQTIGDALNTFVDANPSNATVNFTPQGPVPVQGDVLADFSLRGPDPAPYQDIQKPDIAGPGVNIYAAIPIALGGYANISGTSMATPHNSGSAALVRAVHGDWSVTEVRSAMMMTSFNGGTKEDGTTPWDADDVGTGRIDLSKAALAGLVMDETTQHFLDANPNTGGDPKTLNIPSVRSMECTPNCTFTRTVRNTLTSATSWTASGNPITPGFSIDVQPSSFSFTGGLGETQELTITVTPNTNLTSSVAFGEVVLHQGTNGGRPNGLIIPDERITVAIKGSPGGVTPTPTPTPSGSCPPVITESTSQDIVSGNSVACNDNNTGFTVENHYWRAFDMASFTGGAEYDITSISFGIEQASSGSGTGQPVTVNLYTNSGAPFPGGTLTLLATSGPINIPDQSLSIFDVPIVATVPAGTSELVMEVTNPDGVEAGNMFFVGSNADPETAPSYLSAVDCGVNDPTPVGDLGFPNMHIVFNVNGTCPGGTPTPTPTATATATATVTPTATPRATPRPRPTPHPRPTPP
ncbi:MAG TPA: S8 family serine peptidase [Candidatus Udaeobacter sp.]|jgi:subtilisin family serine protease|nr:S8 family serine peptidase [Candidatus Udaeobacter sp.]